MIDKIMLHRIAIIVTLCLFGITAQPQNGTISDFDFKEWKYGNTVFPYREARMAYDEASTKPALVVYLHGGSKRGNDNIKQMSETAIGVIADYLLRKNVNSIMIVPQCPDSLTWGVKTNEAIKSLIDNYVDVGSVDVNRIFLLGGSMGGTGTWLMSAAYPGLFAAVMPVAGNPSNIDIESISYTPVYAVMGLQDDLIPMQPSISVITTMKDTGSEALIDIETDFSHVKACTDSYTDERLDWLFGHISNQNTN